jgi:hypothetical protein
MMLPSDFLAPTYTEDDLARINSMTKYPSIPTYHVMGERGMLTDKVVEIPDDATLHVTEKVDGTNGRVILLPEGMNYLIGSREDLLHYRGDVIANPALGIVAALKPVAEALLRQWKPTKESVIRVAFVEVFGKGIGSESKQYTGTGLVSTRAFDTLQLSLDQVTKMFGWDIGDYSTWREGRGGGPTFDSVDKMLAGIEGLERVPALKVMPRSELPTSIEETYEWLKSVISKTNVALDSIAGGRPEGVVIRSPHRINIVKLRFEDYERTLRRKK